MSDKENQPVPTPEEVISGTDTEKMIKEVEATEMNKKIALITHVFFQNLAKVSPEESYLLAFTIEGKNSPRLLELVNDTFKEIIDAGGDLPIGHFDHYKKLVTDFVNTLVFYLDDKFAENKNNLVAKSVGKSDIPARVSHVDIIKALS